MMKKKMMFDSETNKYYDNEKDKLDCDLLDRLNNRNKLFHVGHWTNDLIDHWIDESLNKRKTCWN